MFLSNISKNFTFQAFAFRLVIIAAFVAFNLFAFNTLRCLLSLF